MAIGYSIDQISDLISSALGHIDLWFNDLYLKFDYLRAIHLLSPNYAVFLGDLISRQDITDDEFQWRAERFHFIYETVSIYKYVYIGSSANSNLTLIKSIKVSSVYLFL
jgi:hypothetical protein